MPWNGVMKWRVQPPQDAGLVKEARKKPSRCSRKSVGECWWYIPTCSGVPLDILKKRPEWWVAKQVWNGPRFSDRLLHWSHYRSLAWMRHVKKSYIPLTLASFHVAKRTSCWKNFLAEDSRNVGGIAQAWCPYFVQNTWSEMKRVLNEHFLEEVERNWAVRKSFRFGRMVEFDTRRVLEQTSTPLWSSEIKRVGVEP